MTGFTGSTNFPTTAGAFQTTGGATVDAFVTKLNPTGSLLVYSTYLGGSGVDDGLGITVDARGNAYVTGFTGSTNFPTTAGAFQTTGGGREDAFVAKIIDIVLPPPTTVGRVTGGGSINVPNGIGTFGFSVQRQAADASIRGDLRYVNHANGERVHSVTFDSFVITGNMATFGGTCTNNGMPCTFTVNATENDSAGGQGSFNITIDAGPTEGAGEFLCSGAIEIRRVAISRGDGAPDRSDSPQRRRAEACHSDSSDESARDR